MPTINHKHILKRVRTQPNRYMCTAPTCTYSITKDLIDNKEFQCPFCHDPYRMTRERKRLALPHCGCTKGTKDHDESAEEQEIANKLLGGIGNA